MNLKIILQEELESQLAKVTNFVSQKYVNTILKGEYLEFRVTNVYNDGWSGGIMFDLEPNLSGLSAKNVTHMYWLLQFEGETLLMDFAGRLGYMKSDKKTKKAAMKEMVAIVLRKEKENVQKQLSSLATAINFPVRVRLTMP
jgi:hypothetical protein